MQQSFIVYRNPLEQMFWESGLIFPLIVSLLFGFAASLLISTAFHRNVPLRYRKYSGLVACCVAFIVIGGTLYFMGGL